MPAPFGLHVGKSRWELEVPGDQCLELHHAQRPNSPEPAAILAREALEHPYQFQPMRRALTPDDRVAIVLDPGIPALPDILSEVLNHLASGGISSDAVTIVTPSGTQQDWIEKLPEEWGSVRREIHDPSEHNNLAYLSTTQAGRRIYLNRTVVEADFVVVISGRKYDPIAGYAGAELSLFPSISDEEALNSFVGEMSTKSPIASEWPVRLEALEVVHLLGMPFLIQVIEGADDTVAQVVAGLPPSSEEGMRQQDLRWHATVSEPADTVILALSGENERITFLDLARAAACGARVVPRGGRIAILSTASPELGEGAHLLRSLDGTTGARKRLAREKPKDWAACLLWLFAVRHHSIFLASGYPDDVVEQLFATPIRTVEEVQRLIAGGGKVLVVPDGHKFIVTISEPS